MSDPYDLSGGGDAPEDKPKIIVDSDWKAEAQAEKERLTQESESAASERAGGGPEGMPPADFRSLLGSMVTQALVYMGGFPDPQTGRAVVALDYAKHYIDLIGVLEEKTAGNLTDEETKEMQGVLQELRMRFVELSRSVAGAASAQQGGAPPPADPE